MGSWNVTLLNCGGGSGGGSCGATSDCIAIFIGASSIWLATDVTRRNGIEGRIVDSASSSTDAKISVSSASAERDATGGAEVLTRVKALSSGLET